MSCGAQASNACRMIPRRRSIVGLMFVCFTFLVTAAQTPRLEPDVPPDQHVPTVTFAFELPGTRPGHYSVAVASTGQAAYRSEEEAGAGTPGEPYMMKFVISRATAKRIFDLVRGLNYFQGDFEYRNGRIANLGAKTLTYSEGTRHTQTSINYSVNPQMQALIKLFQDMANSLEFGRRLTYLYRYDKLGLDAELKGMEQEAKNKNLAELQVDEAILRQISNDHSIMNISRRRADHLLTMITSNPVAQSAAHQ